ncbi:YncE family protein [Umezawaea beigongshangensis]|uniref:YncE family protein n=1 Tax=Umezawaea beigongshangensis TaxID=2780383 RepID=UPI0018F218D2|nr:hypothetical protein [Umezawaea beigongshangensis]
MLRKAAVLFTSALLVAGCSTGERSDDPLQLAANPEAAKPATSPEQTTAPAGEVLPLDGVVTALAFDASTATLAVAVAEPPSVLLYDTGNLAAAPRSTPLPGPAVRLTGAGGRLTASVPDADEIVRVALPGGEATAVPVADGPTDTTTVGDRTLLAQRDTRRVTVLSGGDPGGTEVQRSISGLQSPDQLLVTGDHVVVVDRLRSALFDLDPASDTLGAGLRAGDGAANAVADRYDRVLVTDARGGELLVFSTDPVIMRQRYPVPGTPWAIAYDPERDLAWITLTGTNEVVGLDVAGGEPEERARFATVHQPDSIAVDPGTGRVFIASADRGGIQVVQP